MMIMVMIMKMRNEIANFKNRDSEIAWQSIRQDTDHKV